MSLFPLLDYIRNQILNEVYFSHAVSYHLSPWPYKKRGSTDTLKSWSIAVQHVWDTDKLGHVPDMCRACLANLSRK